MSVAGDKDHIDSSPPLHHQIRRACLHSRLLKRTCFYYIARRGDGGPETVNVTVTGGLRSPVSEYLSEKYTDDIDR